MFKRFDYRVLVGAALILGGVLALLDQSGILKNATSYFWAGLLGIVAAVFLYWFFVEPSRWWAAIPGFTLAGLAISSLLFKFPSWGGLAFLGGIGAGFWAVYIRRREQWWAIIPGGVLVTLGLISALSEAYKVVDTGGVFMAGLGITFLLVAMLAKMKWAFIPAAVLLLIGFFLTPPFVGVLQYIWIGVLLVVGVVLVASSITSKG